MKTSPFAPAPRHHHESLAVAGPSQTTFWQWGRTIGQEPAVPNLAFGPDRLSTGPVQWSLPRLPLGRGAGGVRRAAAALEAGHAGRLLQRLGLLAPHSHAQRHRVRHHPPLPRLPQRRVPPAAPAPAPAARACENASFWTAFRPFSSCRANRLPLSALAAAMGWPVVSLRVSV